MNEQEVIQYFINKGLSPTAAMGMTAYFLGESSLDPTAKNKYSGAYGIGQWLGSRKRALFDMYGSTLTMQNLLDYAWHELNNTHKKALTELQAAKTPEDAADAAFGRFGFMVGTKGAIREMNKYGQDGEDSLSKKRQHAKRLYDTYSLAFYTPQQPDRVQVEPVLTTRRAMGVDIPVVRQVEKVLPDTVVIGSRQPMRMPSISKMMREAIDKSFVRSMGFEPDVPLWELYAPTFKPMLIPKYTDGKDGWTPDQGFTITRRGGKSYVQLGQPAEPTTHRPYWVTARSGLLDYDDLEKGYRAATAGMLPNILTAARNFVQGDIDRGLVNLGWTNDTQTAPDGTQYAIVAPGILNGTGNVGLVADDAARNAENVWRSWKDISDNSKGFVKGLELGMPTSAMVPVGETGLSVRSISPVAYENPVTNPAERQAALDFLRENPQMKDLVDTRIQPGVSEDWAYPYLTMVDHGLRKPVTSTNRYTRLVAEQSANVQPVKTPVIEPTPTPKKTSRQRSRDYYREKVEDKAQGIGKLKRRDFNSTKMLSDGDARHANAGRPSSRTSRLVWENIKNYPESVWRDMNKLLRKYAKLGLSTDEALTKKDVREYAENAAKNYGHNF